MSIAHIFDFDIFNVQCRLSNECCSGLCDMCIQIVCLSYGALLTQQFTKPIVLRGLTSHFFLDCQMVQQYVSCVFRGRNRRKHRRQLWCRPHHSAFDLRPRFGQNSQNHLFRLKFIYYIHISTFHSYFSLSQLNLSAPYHYLQSRVY